jgi:hypothetical protein
MPEKEQLGQPSGQCRTTVSGAMRGIHGMTPRNPVLRRPTGLIFFRVGRRVSEMGCQSRKGYLMNRVTFNDCDSDNRRRPEIDAMTGDRYVVGAANLVQY